MREALLEHFESLQLLRGSQHGFRKGRPCLGNLLTFLDKVTKAMDEGFCVDVIFLDLAKAFDKVSHQKLVEKLKLHGIEGQLARWIAG